ncbi:MAG: beta-glucosidase-like glycosyl hydrolase [Ferruginibacter sp.]|nr:beta-glucosidase-like glycosyl hydrolase [Ferruginibacter sp.]
MGFLHKIFVASGFLLIGLTTNAQKKSISQQVDSLLQLMTLEEKVGQLNQYTGRELTGPGSDKNTNKIKDIRAGLVGSMLNVKGARETREIQEAALQSRLKIPLLFSLDVIHGYKTIFPVPLAEAASWDLDAIGLSARIAAREASASGIHWTFAPMVDIARDPRWGRVMEGAGEDTYLGSLIARARVLGFQTNKLGGTDAIMACAKHFAAYGAAIAGRDYNAVDMSDQMLWETYLPPFKAAADAGVATFMNSFNTLNGIPATGNKYLQRDILKGKWNYRGFVVSDWGSIGEMLPQGFAKDQSDAAFKAITAGSDMDMESRAYKGSLVQLVKDGKVAVTLINDAVKRILYKKFELGLFSDPYKFSDTTRELSVLNDPQSRVEARNMARKTLVLLKNGKSVTGSSILPLQKSGQKIALIGPLGKATRDLEGGWIVKTDSNNVVTIFEGIRNKIGTGPLYAKGTDIAGNAVTGFNDALAAAKEADVIVLAIGESWDMSGEAKSRTSIDIPGQQMALFRAMKATGKPVVAVVLAGRPLTINELADSADAIVYAWFPGTEGGNAIADVLFGDYNPSGKLPISFPRNTGQIPVYYNHNNTGRPVTNPKNIIYKSAYIDAPNTPLYAFGYGLSYSNFSYSDLKLSNTDLSKNGKIVLSFTLTNTSKRAGEEVVQLYLRDLVSSVVRPVKELKDFKKIMLAPGESRAVDFTVDREKLSFYNQQLEWVAEPGEFEIMIGTSSDNILLSTKINLTANK